jgi:hypothetical protein
MTPEKPEDHEHLGVLMYDQTERTTTEFEDQRIKNMESKRMYLALAARPAYYSDAR